MASTTTDAGKPNVPEITLYYLRNSRSQRLLFMLEEMHVPYEIEIFERESTQLAPASLKDVHPLGKAPIVRIGDKVLAESGFIVDYLVEHYAPQFKPKGEQNLIDYGYFMHFAEGSMMPPLLMKLVFSNINQKSPFFIKPIAGMITGQVDKNYIQPNLDTDFRFIESHLKEKSFFAGEEISGADFMMSFPLEAAAGRGGLTKAKYPNIHAWLDRIHARPAYKAAVEKGGRYNTSPKKARASGSVIDTADYSLENPNTLTKYKTAGDISARVLEKVKALCVGGASTLDICNQGDQLLGDETQKVFKGKKIPKGIGFPTSISPNHIATHYSPLPSDTEVVALKEGDVVKITLGAQIDGFGGILADTVVVGGAEVTGRKADVIHAAWLASEAALRLVKPGNKNWDVTEAVQKIAAAFKCKPLEGMLSHEQKRNVVDGKKQFILNPSESQKAGFETVVFEEGEVYGIDILVTTGPDGKVRKTESRTTIYKKADLTYGLKMKVSRLVFSEIQKKFGAFPFTLRALEDEKKAKMGVLECQQHGLLIPYDVLYEREGEYVAQFFTTIALTKTGTVKVAGPTAPNMDKIKSDHKLEDEKLLTVITGPLKPGKPKKKKEKDANGTPGQ